MIRKVWQPSEENRDSIRQSAMLQSKHELEALVDEAAAGPEDRWMGVGGGAAAGGGLAVGGGSQLSSYTQFDVSMEG